MPHGHHPSPCVIAVLVLASRVPYCAVTLPSPPLRPAPQRERCPDPSDVAARQELLREQASFACTAALDHLLLLLAGVAHRDIKVGGVGRHCWGTPVTARASWMRRNLAPNAHRSWLRSSNSFAFGLYRCIGPLAGLATTASSTKHPWYDIYVTPTVASHGARMEYHATWTPNGGQCYSAPPFLPVLPCCVYSTSMLSSLPVFPSFP